MLREFVEQKHVKFYESASDWKDAIRKSCASLEEDDTVEENYKEEIIKCIEKYGPYIVIAPNIAMPHSQENTEGVKRTAISFTKFEKPVLFIDEGEEKPVQLFFTLASCDSEKHLKNMQKLMELLCNDDLVKELEVAKTENDLLELDEKYLR